MNDKTPDNDSTKAQIDVIPQGPDWVLLRPKNPPPWPSDLPSALSEVLRGWLENHPGARVRCTLPFMHGGMVFCIHVWYDQVGQVTRKAP